MEEDIIYIEQRRGEENLYQPIGQGENSLADSEPKHAVPKKGGQAADKQHQPRRELVADDAGEEADVLADVVGHTKHGELLLVETQNRFQRVGVEREVVGAAGGNLNPDGGRQTHPRRPAPGFQLLRHPFSSFLLPVYSFPQNTHTACASMLLPFGEEEKTLVQGEVNQFEDLSEPGCNTLSLSGLIYYTSTDPQIQCIKVQQCVTCLLYILYCTYVTIAIQVSIEFWSLVYFSIPITKSCKLILERNL